MVLHIIPHTHWDREWYAPFQEFRRRLMHVIDELLDIIETEPGYRFLLDGQTALIDDYLAVRPERLEDIRHYAKNGRLDVGPWTTLADTLLTSAETLVQNMHRGRQRVSHLGPTISPMPVAYMPDMFGHAAQMPQILAQFGFRQAVVWRGVPEAIDRTLFTWRGLDGSTILTTHLVDSYSNGEDLPTDPDALVERLTALAQKQRPFDPPGHVLVMNGSDHRSPQKGLTTALTAANALQSNFELRLSSLPTALEAVREATLANCGTSELPEWTGEMRSGTRANVLMGVTSTRVDLKGIQARAERLLERYADPLVTLAGADNLKMLLDVAWNRLVLNSAHDSVCSCSSDETMRQVQVRYEEATQIAEGVTQDALHTLAQQVSDSRFSTGEEGILVWNPSPFPRTDALVIEVSEMSADPSISEAALPIMETPDGTQVRPVLLDYPKPGRARLLLRPPEVPGLGWTTMRLVQPSSGVPASVRRDEAQPQPIAGPGWLDNGIVRVEFEADGTFRIVDPVQKKQLCSGLGALCDGGDIGDTYNWSPPEKNTLVTKPQRVVIGVVKSNSLVGAIRISRTMLIPAAAEEDSSRSVLAAEHIELIVVMTVRLEQGSEVVDVTVTFNNTARDHRLRMLFPLPEPVDGSVADVAFGATSRGLDTEGGKHEQPLPTWPAKRFVDCSGPNTGLALLVDQTVEYEVLRDHPDGPGVEIALTLLRATGWLSRSCPTMRPNRAGPQIETTHSQSLGPQRLHFGLLCHKGNWQDGDVVRSADRFAHPLRWCRITPSPEGSLPPYGNPLGIEADPAVTLSTLRSENASNDRGSDRGAELRVANVSPDEATLCVKAENRWKRARGLTGETQVVDLRGQVLESPAPSSLTLPPWRITTLRWESTPPS